MRKLISFYDQFEEKLLVGSLMFSTALIFIQVIMRSGFNSSLSWSEELSRYIFIWQIWLGTSIALRTDKHISVDILLGAFKSARAKACIRFIGMLIWFLFSLFLLYNGGLLTKSMIARKTLSSGMRIPLYVVYASLPISSLMVCLRLIEKLKYNFLKIVFPEREE